MKVTEEAEEFLKGNDILDGHTDTERAKEIVSGLLTEIERLHPKNGKWYQQLSKCPSAINNGGSRTQKCSLCGGWGKKTFAFCPHCGAKMEIVR